MYMYTNRRFPKFSEAASSDFPDTMAASRQHTIDSMLCITIYIIRYYANPIRTILKTVAILSYDVIA